MKTIGTSLPMNFNPFQVNALFQYSLKISGNWDIRVVEIDLKTA